MVMYTIDRQGEGYRLYNIGDMADESDRYRDGSTNTWQHIDICAQLEESDGAFVKCHGQWIYAIVVKTVHLSCPPYIIFQITPDGSTERIEQSSWEKRVSPLRKQHPSSHHTGTTTIAYHVISEKDDGEQIKLHSITGMPAYANKSFEELRLEDYMDGNKGTANINSHIISIDNNIKWGASDINKFLEVDLGSERIILKRPPLVDGSSMYNKQQCLHIIKTTTVKSSKERKHLIDFLAYNQLVPNTTALYKLLLRDEKGKSITDLNWGVQFQSSIQNQPINMIHWYSRSTMHNLPFLPYPTKKRTRIEDAILNRGEHVRWNVMDEKGWKGRIRLYVTPVKFYELMHLLYDINSMEYPQLTDICMFIGTRQYNEKGSRICRLYFDKRQFPPPSSEHLNEGGSNATFAQLKSYIRYVASSEGSPVVCNGGSSKWKVFTCNQKYLNKEGQKKKCPFSFQVRWDAHGYYIHLLSRDIYNQNCGISWHCCEE